MNKHITKFSLKIVKKSMPIEIISNVDVSSLVNSAQQATEAMRNISSALAQTQMSMDVSATVMQAYNTLLEAVPGLVLPPEHRLHQRAVGVALLAEKMAQNGESGDGNRLTPNYLRLSQAERERMEKQKK